MARSKLILSLVLALSACSAGEDPEESGDQLVQQLPKSPTGGYSCTVEQCNGNLNPFGICTHSVNGVCVECKAGTHVGTCSGPGACVEQNCPPQPPIKAHL